MQITVEEATEQVTRWVRLCAAPAEGLPVRAQIRNAARVLGWPFNRTKKAWYGEARLRHDEFLTLQWKVAQMERRSIDRKERLHELEELVASTLSPPAGSEDEE